MTETRTRVSGDYIKPSGTCPMNGATSTSSYTTRERVSDDYIRPSTSYFGRTFCTSPSYQSRYTPFFSSPRTVYTAPVAPAFRATSLMEDIAGVLIVSALFIGAVAIISLAPRCHFEEVCQSVTFGRDLCHLERVCVY